MYLKISHREHIGFVNTLHLDKFIWDPKSLANSAMTVRVCSSIQCKHDEMGFRTSHLGKLTTITTIRNVKLRLIWNSGCVAILHKIFGIFHKKH